MKYRKYTWIGNRVSDEDMQRLYRIRQETWKRITEQVAEAVKDYIDRQQASQEAEGVRK